VRCVNVKMAFEDVYVPDTSVIIERTLSRLLEEGKLRGRIVIPRILIKFFDQKAVEGSAIGMLGLQELARIRDLAERGLAIVEVIDDGVRERAVDQRLVDLIVREVASKIGGKVITHNELQMLACKAFGIDVLYLKPRIEERLWFEKYMDSETLSLHLKEGAPIRAKKGKPGAWELVTVDNRILSREELELLIEDILSYVKAGNGSIEVERPGSMIVQLKDYRIVIVMPPIGNGYEITIAKPIVKLRLEDYNLPEKLIRRLEERAEGILIAGAPGMGKTTFAQALAEYYSRKGKIVKTIEAPRDMRLPPTISQYSKAFASPGELHDILLLSRPDYTVFDEMRNDEDFKIYIDLRLAGIGMIGVVHATSPIDAIQRFLNRVDLGMVPSIIDTVIFIDRGRVAKVYDISMTVKLPTGLREAELARPVVEVRDFLTGELEYEIYTFGEQTVVVPVKKIQKDVIKERILDIVKKALPYADVEIEGQHVILSVPRMLYTSAINKKVRKLRRRLEKLGFEMEVKLV